MSQQPPILYEVDPAPLAVWRITTPGVQFTKSVLHRALNRKIFFF